MAEQSGFFPDVNGDRQYTTDFLADWVSSFISNGVYNGELAVTAGDGMTVIVRPGKAWINGYILINDDDYVLQLDPADGVLHRIDRVVVRYDTEDREIRIEIKKGTFASTPEPPSLQRDADAYELALADVYVAAGAVSITQSNITDLRLNTELCGIVHGVVDQVDTTTLFNQYVDWYTTTTGQAEADIEAIKQQFQDDLMQFEQGWNDWFSQQQTEGFVMAAEKGQPNGIATLDENGKVPDEQLPEVEVETPAGAQAKADTALNSAKQYTDQEVGEVSQALAAHQEDGAQHAKTARFVIGTSTAGWTAADCDYLCDGTADQTEINAAITALSASGGEIIILNGTYNITAKINVNKDNVSIKGNGNATILKRMWNSSSTEGVITLTSVEGCRVQNLQIDGNKANYSSTNNCGIYLYSSSINTITGNTCNNNSTTGIYLYSSSNENIITGNTCNNNNIHGIRLYSSSNENIITGNTCNNNNIHGIYLDSSSINTITGNTCNNNSTTGICLYSSSNENTIIGNTCNSNDGNGIRLYSSSNNTVTGNTCNNNNDGNGIYLDSSSNENTVIGNTCKNNNENGIRLYSSSNENTITGNTCNNNNIHGIYLYLFNDENTVVGNTCNNNGTVGIYLDSSSNENTITGNTCNNNSIHGIYLYSSSINTITGNTCNNNNDGNGIYLYSSSNENTITGNICNNNNENGICLDSSSNNTVTGNTCIRGTGQTSDYTSSQYTILLAGSSNNYNLISSNNCMGKAVAVNGGTGNSVWGNKFDATNDLP